MKYLTNLDLNGNELQNATIQNLATAPSNPKLGQIYFNTSVKRVMQWDGTAWQPMDAKDAATAISQAHTHSNKAILDATTAIFNTSDDLKLTGIQPGADVTDATNVGTAIHGTAVKTSAVDADEVPLIDSAASNVLKKITWANIKATLKSYFDTLYNNYVHPTGDGNLHVPATGTTNNKKVLTAGTTAGSASWQINSPDWSNITNKPQSTIEEIDNAVNNSHIHNTDTGTTSASFQLMNGAEGPIIFASDPTTIMLRNSDDSDFIDLKVGNLIVEGTSTVINSNIVSIGDSEIELNTDITASTQNANGGITIKRLATDNVTRKDAKLTYIESSSRWYATIQSGSGNMLAMPIILTQSLTIGDGTTTSFAIPHSLHNRGFAVTISENVAPYGLVYADVEYTTLDSITIRFATAPAANQYYVTLMG